MMWKRGQPILREVIEIFFIDIETVELFFVVKQPAGATLITKLAVNLMKYSARNSFKFLSTGLCILFLANHSQAAVSYWDPEGFRGVYGTYTGGVLNGTWENNS